RGPRSQKSMTRHWSGAPPSSVRPFFVRHPQIVLHVLHAADMLGCILGPALDVAVVDGTGQGDLAVLDRALDASTVGPGIAHQFVAPHPAVGLAGPHIALRADTAVTALAVPAAGIAPRMLLDGLVAVRGLAAMSAITIFARHRPLGVRPLAV